jgi:hypothetical protein
MQETERELAGWLVTVILPIIVSCAGFYLSSQNKTSTLEKRLTTLEVVNAEQEKVIDSHNRRLDKHEEEQKITLALVERIDHLSSSINDLKGDITEIKQAMKGKW